jgi:hypothetical protein
MDGTEVIQFRRFQDEEIHAWDTFVDRCDEAWVNHRTAFVESVPYSESFSILIDGIMQGICVLGREKRRMGAYLTGPGIALMPEARTETVYRAVSARLRTLAAQAGCEAVEFVLPPMAPANRRRLFCESSLRACAFSSDIRWRRAWERLPAYFSVIDLRLDLEEILKDFSKGQKANVKRCAKQGLQAVVKSGAEVTDYDWADFVHLHHTTYARTGGVPFSDSRLERLLTLVRSGKAALVNGVADGRCVTSLLLTIDKAGAFYYAGGALDEARRQGAMAWGQFAAVSWLKQHDFTHYCVGFTVPALSATETGGIGDFKKRFGGEQWPMLCGDLVLRAAPFLIRHHGSDVVRGCARLMRKAMQNVGGHLRYSKGQPRLR